MCAKAYVVPSPLTIRVCELKIPPLLANLAIWKIYTQSRNVNCCFDWLHLLFLQSTGYPSPPREKMALRAFFFSQKNHHCKSHDPETADSRGSSYSRGCSVLAGCNEWWFWASTIPCHIECSNRSRGSGCTIFLQAEAPVLPGSTTTEHYNDKYCINVLAKYGLFPKELSS